MKRFFSTIIAILAVTNGLYAQDGFEARSGSIHPKNEVSISCGTLSLPHCAFIFAGIVGTTISGGMVKATDISTGGAVGLEYMRYLNRHIAVGGTYVGEKVSMTVESYDKKDENGNVIYKQGDAVLNNYVTLMPSVRLPWFYRDHFSMYTSLGAGVCANLSDKSAFLAFQVNPVGMEIGGGNVRAFAEAGFGMKGLVTGGARIAF